MDQTKKRGKRAVIVLIAVILLAALLCGIHVLRVYCKKTASLSYISAAKEPGVYYAHADMTSGVVKVESDIDLVSYLADYDAEVLVSGTVTKLTVGHHDCMGIMLPCLCYEFRADAVISPAEPVHAAEEEASLAARTD